MMHCILVYSENPQPIDLRGTSVTSHTEQAILITVTVIINAYVLPRTARYRRNCIHNAQFEMVVDAGRTSYRTTDA